MIQIIAARNPENNEIVTRFLIAEETDIEEAYKELMASIYNIAKVYSKASQESDSPISVDEMLEKIREGLKRSYMGRTEQDEK